MAQFRKAKDPFYVTDFGMFKIGDTLQLGRGSGPDGSYHYIQQKQTFLNIDNAPLVENHQGQLVLVQALHYWLGWHGKWPFVLVRIDGYPYRVALVEALRSNEIIKIVN